MRVNEAVVISLPERQDRRMKLLRSLPAAWPFPALRFVDGVREDPAPWFRSSRGAWGCAQAHLGILRSAWERGVESTLVLEDDATFCPNFPANYERFSTHLPSNWSMLMLGGEHALEPERVGAHVVRCINTRRTHAYIVRLRAIPLLIRTWQSATRHIDHSNLRIQRAAHVYAPTQFLIGQAAGTSDISGKDNPERFWKERRQVPELV